MTLATFLATADLDDQVALIEAQSHTVTSYRKIGGNEARQFFSMFGAIRPLEAAVSNTSIVQVLAGVDTTIGELAQVVIETMQSSTSKFATDPNEEDGALNRSASALLVTAGVFAQATVDAFFSSSEVIATPFSKITLHSVKIARDAVTLKPVTQVNGYVTIETNAGSEMHNPRLMALNPRTGLRQRINNFAGVSWVGKYDAVVPTQWRNAELFVDDVYGVIL